LLSSHDTKNVINASEIPKLKRVIQSAVMDHPRGYLIFILFDNLAYIIATVTDGNTTQSNSTDFIMTGEKIA
jgi:hypothetical protein